jgi:phosphate transport system substrate-binding protein
MKTVLITLIALLLSLIACTSQQATVQPGEGGVKQTSIQNKGSDTMVNLALAWAEQYQEDHPEVSISVTGGGSGTGITALANQTVDIANASRAINLEEVNSMDADGIVPVEFVVARDAIAVIVNPNNPVESHLAANF